MTEHDPAQDAIDRVIGLGVLADEARAADPERAKAEADAASPDTSVYRRREAKVTLAQHELRAGREDARLARLREAAEGAWSAEALATIDYATIATAEAKTLDEAITKFDRFAASEHAPKVVKDKAAFGRMMLRQAWSG